MKLALDYYWNAINMFQSRHNHRSVEKVRKMQNGSLEVFEVAVLEKDE